MQKEQILAELRRTAEENGGKPLGRERFERVTGIKPYDWNKYWARFGDAQKEAGFEPNTLMAAYDESHLLGKLADLMLELGKFPTHAERRMKSFNDSDFPNPGTFQRMGDKRQVINKLLDYCATNSTYSAILPLLNNELAAMPSTTKKSDSADDASVQYGYVYLFKSGRYYKIGMTKDMVRRGTELRIQLPERMDLIHSIQTDDPSGIEAYWHKRLADKRMNGEWFDLSSADVRAFKRWRKIY